MVENLQLSFEFLSFHSFPISFWWCHGSLLIRLLHLSFFTLPPPSHPVRRLAVQQHTSAELLSTRQMVFMLLPLLSPTFGCLSANSLIPASSSPDWLSVKPISDQPVWTVLLISCYASCIYLMFSALLINIILLVFIIFSIVAHWKYPEM